MKVADLFGIPNDGEPLIFRKIEAGTHDGRTHSFAVRVRPESDHVDVMLADIGPNGYGYHCRTSTDSRLIQAVYSDTAMHEVPDGIVHALFCRSSLHVALLSVLSAS